MNKDKHEDIKEEILEDNLLDYHKGCSQSYSRNTKDDFEIERKISIEIVKRQLIQVFTTIKIFWIKRILVFFRTDKQL